MYPTGDQKTRSGVNVVAVVRLNLVGPFRLRESCLPASPHLNVSSVLSSAPTTSANLSSSSAISTDLLSSSPLHYRLQASQPLAQSRTLPRLPQG